MAQAVSIVHQTTCGLCSEAATITHSRPTLLPLIFISLLSVSATNATAQAQAPSSARSASPDKPEPSTARLLYEESAAYPVEIQTYVLFAAYSHLRPDEKNQVNLEDLFRATAGSQMQYPVKSTRPVTDDSAAYEQAASSLGVDALSSQIHLIQLIRDVDLAKAVSLFEDVQYPDLAPLKCSSVTVPDVSNYFRMLSLLYTGTATDLKLRQRLNAVVTRRLGQMTILDASFIAGFALDMDADSSWSTWMAIFTARLAALYTDDRSASYALMHQELPDRLRRLGEFWSTRSGPTLAFMTAYRSLLLSVYQGDRCDDNVTLQQALPKDSALSPLVSFNDLLSTLGLADKITPLPTRINSASIVESASLRTTNFWQTIAEKNLLAALGDIQQHGDPGDRVASLLPVLKQGLCDPSSTEDPLKCFHEEASAYTALASAAQTAAMQDAVNSDLISFLASRYNSGTVPIAHWLLEVDKACDLTRSAGEQQAQLSREFEARWKTPYPVARVKDAGSFLDLMLQSREPALSLIGRLEKAFPGETK
jgi:hypothetical protein